MKYSILLRQYDLKIGNATVVSLQLILLEQIMNMSLSHLSFIGDNAVFKAKVTGNPQPTVSWERASGCLLSDASSFCDKINNQYILKV